MRPRGPSCTEQERLSPNERGYHCTRCNKDVIDLTRLTRKQAKPYMKPGTCVKLSLGPNGEPVFAPEIERSGLRSMVWANHAGAGLRC